ncbi:MAG: purine phosphoribosyltransferase family protein, partial [Candidatus Limnocylindrus sp.]
MNPEQLASKVRTIPDFPKPGIIFRDITTLLQDAEAFNAAIEAMLPSIRAQKPDVIVGIESRGFIFGAPIAHALGLGFVPVRKLGKL